MFSLQCQFGDWCFHAVSGVGSRHVCASPVCSLPQGWVLRVSPSWEESGLCLLFFKRPDIWSSSSRSKLKVETGFCAVCFSCFRLPWAQRWPALSVSPWMHLMNYKASFIWCCFSSGANPDIHAPRAVSRVELMTCAVDGQVRAGSSEGFRDDQCFTLFLFVFLMLTKFIITIFKFIYSLFGFIAWHVGS